MTFIESFAKRLAVDLVEQQFGVHPQAGGSILLTLGNRTELVAAAEGRDQLSSVALGVERLLGFRA